MLQSTIRVVFSLLIKAPSRRDERLGMQCRAKAFRSVSALVIIAGLIVAGLVANSVAVAVAARALAGASHVASSSLALASVRAKAMTPRTRAVSSPLLRDDFSSLAVGSKYTDGDEFGNWAVQFAGYGSVQVVSQANHRLRLTPAAASSTSETHSALVVSRGSFNAPCLKLGLRQRTTSQLRSAGTANPWETAWVVWDYVDNDHFSYLTFKPNGWEMGKRDPAYPGGQRFLATGESVLTPVGTWRSPTITRRVISASATSIQVKLGATTVATFVDSERPYTNGKIGFYTEDAVADFDDVNLVRCS